MAEVFALELQVARLEGELEEARRQVAAAKAQCAEISSAAKREVAKLEIDNIRLRGLLSHIMSHEEEKAKSNATPAKKEAGAGKTFSLAITLK